MRNFEHLFYEIKLFEFKNVKKLNTFKNVFKIWHWAQ